MNRPDWKAFLRRRLSLEEYLGLHLTIGLLLSAAALGLFACVAHVVIGQGAIVRFDDELGESLAHHRETHPWMRSVFFGVTQFGSVELMTGLVIAVALLLLVRRQRLLALVWLFAVAGGGLLDAGLKLVFQRERPPFRDAGILETTASFPSGHSMGSVIAYGLLAYFLALILPRGWARRAIVAALVLVVVLIGSSRIYLGAHYFSDVLGGFLVGAAWLAACISGIETVRRRKNTNSSPGQGSAHVSSTQSGCRIT
ncbi:MAG TPA: phosphatase PAP2 family protein, partial [Pirellulales bacterium]|nr:phosphatase PAP2 family protein [Pirellulales bacterium]